MIAHLRPGVDFGWGAKAFACGLSILEKVDRQFKFTNIHNYRNQRAADQERAQATLRLCGNATAAVSRSGLPPSKRIKPGSIPRRINRLAFQIAQRLTNLLSSPTPAGATGRSSGAAPPLARLIITSLVRAVGAGCGGLLKPNSPSQPSRTHPASKPPSNPIEPSTIQP
jgi:hypothetical protein